MELDDVAWVIIVVIYFVALIAGFFMSSISLIAIFMVAIAFGGMAQKLESVTDRLGGHNPLGVIPLMTAISAFIGIIIAHIFR